MTSTYDWTAAIEAAKCMWLPEGEPIAPFSWVDSDGSVRTFVGGQKSLLAITGHHVPSPPLQPDTIMPGTRKVKLQFLNEKLLQPVVTFGADTVGSLRALCGLPHKPGKKAKADCPECHGIGRVECYACGHEHDCKGCDGEGETGEQVDSPELRLIHVGTVFFDARHLAEHLALVPDGPVTVGLADWGKDMTALAISGDGWTIRLGSNFRREPETIISEWLPMAS